MTFLATSITTKSHSTCSCTIISWYGLSCAQHAHGHIKLGSCKPGLHGRGASCRPSNALTPAGLGVRDRFSLWSGAVTQKPQKVSAHRGVHRPKLDFSFFFKKTEIPCTLMIFYSASYLTYKISQPAWIRVHDCYIIISVTLFSLKRNTSFA